MTDRGNGSTTQVADGVRSEEDEQHALDYLMAHTQQAVQPFLQNKGLAFSGTKPVLRRRIEGYLADGSLTVDDIIEHLDRIEGWGNQHVYLYASPPGLADDWRSETHVRRVFGRLGLESLLNGRQSLLLPDEPTLCAAEWSDCRLRLVWVEKREWEERVPEEDRGEGEMIWRAYCVNTARGIITFDWDLLSQGAMLMIQRLPRGTVYTRERDRFARDLQALVDIGAFSAVRVGRAMQHLDSSDEVRRRQTRVRTKRGSKASFSSPRRSQDVREDPDILNAASALGSAMGEYGNYYWVRDGRALMTDMHITIYTDDERVGIFGEKPEQEVRHVLSRIRELCR